MEFKPSARLGLLPLALSLVFAGFVAAPHVRANPILLRTFLITAGFLAGWALLLRMRMDAQGRTPEFAVSILKQHWVQACAHTSILVYWGWYYPPVYGHATFILAQLVFAYAFDMLLQLSRKGRYTLGFGPFPIIFSINLFLWFQDDWFYLQFVLIAMGFAAKEFLHWMKGGKSVHIFNPSSFPLAIFSWLLLLTHHFEITWGEQIASEQILPPHIYLFIFLVSLPGQLLFGVTTTILPAVATMYLWSASYLALTGVYPFLQSYIPIAVFLAMNLLITDPSTSPRTELGRIFYGFLYGVTVILLEVTTMSFASKLLVVPLLNLLVIAIDRAVQSPALRRFDPARIAPDITGRRRNLAYVTIWIAVFGLMTSLRGLGDDYPGQDLPFWREACRNRLEGACSKALKGEVNACFTNSGWACNEVAIRKHDLHQDQLVPSFLSRACQLGFQPGCDNQKRTGDGELARAPPRLSDYPILLSDLKSAKRPGLEKLPPAELYAEACRHRWAEACQLK